MFMLILGIETTSSVGSIALSQEDKVLGGEVLDAPLRHSRYIIPAIHKLLKEHAYTLNDIDMIAVGTGPGSFTGIRVGIAIVKGLVFDSTIRVVGVPSLANIALNCDTDKTIYSMIYAQRNEFFIQQFKKTGENNVVEYSECMIVKPEEIPELLEHPCVVCGPDSQKYAAYKDLWSCEVVSQPVYPTARSAARIGFNQAKTGTSQSLVPIYIRRSDAEEKGAKVYKLWT